MGGTITFPYIPASATAQGYLTTGTQSFAGNKSWSGTQDVANAIRSTGGVNFDTGAGVTLFYSAGTGYLRAANEGVAFTPLIVQSSTFALEIGGVNAFTVNAARDFLGSGNLVANTLGAGFKVKEGANATMGSAVLVGGTVTVATTKVTANSRIIVTSNVDGGTPGWLRVSARVDATSFTITSSSGTDTSTVSWVIFEPAA